MNRLFLPFVDAQVIWNYVATIWGVHRIGREALRLRPAFEDPMLGLRPLGSLSLGATFYYFGALAIIIAEVTLSPDPFRPAYLAFLILLILFGAGLLFLPLVSIHRLMVAEKRRAMDTASSRAGDVYAPLTAGNPTSEPVCTKCETCSSARTGSFCTGRRNAESRPCRRGRSRRGR